MIIDIGTIDEIMFYVLYYFRIFLIFILVLIIYLQHVIGYYL